jgi:hypothetical protein
MGKPAKTDPKQRVREEARIPYDCHDHNESRMSDRPESVLQVFIGPSEFETKTTRT